MAEPNSAKNNAALGLILLALATLPLARGGYLSWAESTFGVAIAIALLLSTPSCSSHQDRLFQASLLLWLLWILWQCLQLAPLPATLLQQLSQDAWAHWKLVREQGIALHPSLALLPDQARRQSLNSLGLLALYLATRRVLWNHPLRLQWFLLGLVLIGVFQAVYGALVQLTSFQLSWIEPTPPVHLHSAHGSFPNRNHFAAFLLIPFASALALLLGGFGLQKEQLRGGLRRSIDVLNSPVPLLRIAMLLIVVGIVLSRSRMGNTAFAVSLTLCGLIWLLRTRDTRSFLTGGFLFLSIALIDVLVVTDRFGIQRVLERIESTDLSTDARSLARSMSWQIIERFGLTGAGHGSFQQLEQWVRPSPAVDTFIHAHNDHLEFIIEFGWIGYALLTGLLVIHCLMAIRALRSRRPLHQAAGAAFLMICSAAALHASVESQFHIPAYRTLFVGTMAIVAALPPPRFRRKSLIRSRLRPRDHQRPQ